MHKKREHSKNKRGANLGLVEVQSRAHEKIWCAHKEKERERAHTKNKRGKQKEKAHKEQERQTKKREHSKNKRGANLGVVEVKSRAHVKIWCAHKEKERYKEHT